MSCGTGLSGTGLEIRGDRTPSTNEALLSKVHQIDAALMIKRIAAATLWFLSMGYAYALVAHFLALPAAGSLIVGAVAAAFVALDPTGVFWGPRKRDLTEAKRADVPGLAAPNR